MPIPIDKILAELGGQSVEKLIDKYGERVLLGAAELVGDVVQDHAPEILEKTAEYAGDLMQFVSPTVTQAAGKVNEFTGLTLARVIGQGSSEALGSILENIGDSVPDVDLAALGQQVRETVGKGAGKLGDLTDAQLGALAVYFSRSKEKE
jgi:hypothetical protein